MNTSVQPHGFKAIAFESFSGWAATLAAKTGDSSAPAAESEFHKVLKQGDLLSEDDDQNGARDNAPASRDRENGSPDSAYLLADAIPLTPSRPMVQPSSDSAPEQTGESTPDAPAVEDPTKLPLSGAVPAPAAPMGQGRVQRAVPRWPAAPAQSKTSSSDSQVTSDSKRLGLSAGQARVPSSTTRLVDQVEREDGVPGQSLGENSGRAPLADARGSATGSTDGALNGTATVRERSKSTLTQFSTPAVVGSATIAPATPPSTTTPTAPAKAIAPQPEDDQEIAAQGGHAPLETKPEQTPDSATLTALLLNPSDATPSVAVDAPALPLEPAQAPQSDSAHATPRKTTPPNSPSQSAQVAPTPELVSLSPAPAAVEESSSNVESPAPSKTAQVNAPIEWSVESDDSRVSEAASSNSSDPVVFEAKLTPDPVAPAPAAPTTASVAPLPASPAAAKSIPVESDEADAAPQVKTETLFKTDLPAQISSAPIQSEARPTVAPQPEAPIATQMQPLLESPAATASSHAVTVNVRESPDDPGVNLRFVERGGEIHVSVRTSDLGLAQDMRGGLNDLTGRLEHAGIRTEISNLSTSEPNSQRDAQQPPPDHRGSGRQSQDSQREQPEPRKNNPSAWQEAFENSANANSHQEQTL